MINFRPKAKFDQEASVVILSQERVKKANFAFSNKVLEKSIQNLVKANQFSGDCCEYFPLVIENKLFFLVGIGSEKECSLTSLRMTVRKALMSCFLSKRKNVELVLSDPTDAQVIAAIEGALIGTYSFRKYKSVKKDDKTVYEKNIFLVAANKDVFARAVKVCEGVNLTRNLVNENADVANSIYLEGVVKDLIRGNKNITSEILGEKELKAKGLHLHLAVNQGSRNEPKLLIIKYQGASSKDPYTALIGKGMTFDTGGLNLKPTGSIETMKIDMSGAAAVIGVLKNTVSLKLKKNILFVMAIAENVTGSKSYKPGDIITGYAGKSVEIANTDAEGRLVLADAISYVNKNYKPARIIDIATLTGACVVALGNDYTGLVSCDDKFARDLVHASNETDDRIWRLPNYPELKDSVKSQDADIRNLGFPKGAGGAITAAEFLRQFTNGTMWAHLDIAGTAYVDGSERMYFAHGATGAGVRLLTRYLHDH